MFHIRLYSEFSEIDHPNPPFPSPSPLQRKCGSCSWNSHFSLEFIKVVKLTIHSEPCANLHVPHFWFCSSSQKTKFLKKGLIRSSVVWSNRTQSLVTNRVHPHPSLPWAALHAKFSLQKLTNRLYHAQLSTNFL